MPDMNHFMCTHCGRSFGDSWIDEFGMKCLCGGELEKVDAEDLPKADNMPYYQQLRKPRVFGSSK